jgi:hypothetical protein
MTKARLLETLRSKRAEWDSLVAEVSIGRMTEPGVTGDWSVKDIIVHLTYHERWIADRLHEGLRGEAYTPNELDRLSFDERNDIVFQQNRNRPLSDVLDDSRQAFQKLLDGVQAHSEQFLLEPQQVEGAPQPIIIWQFIRGDVYEHYGLHAPSIRSWLATRHA